MKIPPKSRRWHRCRSIRRYSIGQAVGSAIGGVLYARDLLYGAGYVSMGFVAPALMTVMLTKPRRGSGAGPVMFCARTP
jgi:predicted MFS family arabinose efflux permease